MTVQEFLRTQEAKENLTTPEILLLKEYIYHTDLDYSLCNLQAIGHNIDEVFFLENRQRIDEIDNSVKFTTLMLKVSNLMCDDKHKVSMGNIKQEEVLT